jgi:(E)-4-hydroxy-3-methylbut-2-enyl-diphosphate synthase
MFVRRNTSITHVGNVEIGGDNPIRIQSMANTSTMDTEGSVEQAKRIVDAGGEIVRFTTQGQREALNMQNISRALRADGYDVPLVADVHFNAAVADTAALYCEKVRINPGNYVDPGRKFKHIDYTPLKESCIMSFTSKAHELTNIKTC